jgi:hypothetical protein
MELSSTDYAGVAPPARVAEKHTQVFASLRAFAQPLAGAGEHRDGGNAGQVTKA